MSYVRFDFTDEAPGRWNERLAEIRASGATSLSTRLYWGAHESLRGTRDFSKASRLRLERFLQAVHDAGLHVDISLGFPAGREALPEWTQSLPMKTLVPGAVCDREGVVAVDVPSPHAPEFRTAFHEYLSEALGILALYRHPDGPVADVRLDFGLYEQDLCAVESEAFHRALERRYGTVRDLNLCYATAFKTFAAAASRQGLRVLNDKRTWLAAFDYKWCRSEALREWRDEILALDTAQALSDLLSADAFRPSPVRGAAPWQIVFDPALLEVTPDDRLPCAPFTPSGFVGDVAANAFRLWDFFADNARGASVGVDWLPLWEPPIPAARDVLVVVCGKYLSSAAFAALEEHLGGGGSVLFPLALPQYDEKLVSHSWAPLRDRVSFVHDGRPLARFDAGAGRVWLTHQPLTLDDSMWSSVSSLAAGLVSERTLSS